MLDPESCGNVIIISGKSGIKRLDHCWDELPEIDKQTITRLVQYRIKEDMW